MNLLLAAAFLFQEKTSEETFKKIEDTLEKAKTISIRMKYKVMILPAKPGVAPSEKETRALILLNESNMVHVAVDPNPMFKGGQDDLSVLSDGSHLRVIDPSGAVARGDTPKGLSSGFKVILVRTGYFGAQYFIPRRDPLDPPAKPKEPDLKTFLEQDLKKQFQLSGFVSGKDNDGEWLKYTLKVGENEEKLQATLWFSPTTYKLLKRQLVMPFMGNSQISCVETYDEFTLNADLPNEKFKLPGEK